MYAFTYHRATSARQAANLLAKAEDAKLLAGGHTLLPTMKNRLASPKNIIDLSKIAELKGVERKGKTIVIGAMTTHAEVAGSAIVKEALPGLAALAGGIGDPQVRHKGTIGGSVANNDPSADYPAGLMALNAVIVTNKRKIAADDYFQGMFATALDDGEMITKIVFPVASKFAYAKFPNPASRYALVGVAVAKKGASVRVAVTGAGSNGVFRWADAEKALSARFNAKSADGLKAASKGLNSDIHASADYRAHLIGVMVKRAVAAATGK
ncbi:MAG: FAD binding domain-containing protein [Beijerinckiaceae bacterium]